MIQLFATGFPYAYHPRLAALVQCLITAGTAPERAARNLRIILHVAQLLRSLYKPHRVAKIGPFVELRPSLYSAEKDTFVRSLGLPERDEKGDLPLNFLAAGKGTQKRCPTLGISRPFYQDFRSREREDKGSLLGETFRALEKSELG